MWDEVSECSTSMEEKAQGQEVWWKMFMFMILNVIGSWNLTLLNLWFCISNNTTLL